MERPPPVFRGFPDFRFIRQWGGHRIFCRLMAVAMGLQFLWLFENYRGARAVQQEIDRLEAQGEWLRWDPALLPGRVPDEENFGAAACLRDIIEAADEYGRGRKRPEWRDIPGLEGLQFGSPAVLRTGFYPGRPPVQRKTARVLPLPRTPDGGFIDWGEWRRCLVFSDYFPMIFDDVPDAWAVLRGFDELEPVFARLAEAAGRPHAFFLPPPRERFAEKPPEWDDADRSDSRLARLMTLITARGYAAIACEDGEEAARMLRILIKFSDALDHEFGFFRDRAGCQDFFLAGIQRHVWDTEELDEFSAAFTFDANACFLHNVRIHMLYDGLDRITVGKHFFMRLVNQAPRWFIPQGWEDQARALKIRIYRTEMLEPLKARGMAGLIGDTESFQRQKNTVWSPLWKGWMSSWERRPTDGWLFVEMERRLLLIAAAAEKHRLGNARYPDRLPVLPGSPEQWLDLDGKPLRYAAAEGGIRARISSVAFDLQPDPPASEKASSPSRARPRGYSERERGRDWVIELSCQE